MSYLLPLHEPLSVRHAVRCSFLAPNESSLVVTRPNRLEVYELVEEDGGYGLVSQHTINLYARPTGLLAFRPAGSETDHVFVFTEMHDYFTISYDRQTGGIKNEQTAINIADSASRPSEAGHLTVIDPQSRMIGMIHYKGLFAAISLPRKKKIDWADVRVVRLKEMNALAITFLDGPYANPILALLYRDDRQARHLITYEVVVKNDTEELVKWEMGATQLDASANLLIAVPYAPGGVIVVGEQAVCYVPVKGKQVKQSIGQPTIYTTFCPLEGPGYRFLLADEYGGIHVMVLLTESSKKVTGIQLSRVGDCSVASSLVYLGNSMVYLGSHFGDAQLLALLPSAPYLSILQSFPNLAPITDFIVDEAKEGQSGLITCSGGFHDGALKITQSGVGLDEVGIIPDLPGVRRIWAFSLVNQGYDDTLVVSTVNSTRVLRIARDGEVEETTIEGISTNDSTLELRALGGGKVVHVTPQQAVIIDINISSMLARYPSDSQISFSTASANESCLLITRGSEAILLDLRNLNLMATYTLDNEISCCNAPLESNFAAFGTWTRPEVTLLSLPDLRPIISESLGSTVPREILVTTLASMSSPTLLVSLGDGALVMYQYDNGKLMDRRTSTLGTQPVGLNLLSSSRGANQFSVFASGDRPSLIHAEKGRVSSASINVRGVVCATGFSSPAFPDSLVVATDSEIKIGVMDSANSIQIQSLPLGQLPRRIETLNSTGCIAVGSLELIVNLSGDEVQRGWIKLIDKTLFEVIDEFALDENESLESLAVLPSSDDSSELLVAGTGYNQLDKDESDTGRILILYIDEDRKLQLEASADIQGTAYCLGLLGRRIVAGINSMVSVYEFTPDPVPPKANLVSVASYRSTTLALTISIVSDFIVLGDLMKSVSILQFDPTTNIIRETARDFTPMWMTDVEALDDVTFLGADADGHAVVFSRDPTAVEEEMRKRLTVTSEIRLGEMVNRIRRLNTTTFHGAVTPMAYMVTVDGGAYLYASIHPQFIDLLLKLQENLQGVIKGVGALEHRRFRAFQNSRRQATEPLRFVDGLLIERFLDMDEGSMTTAVQGTDASVQDVLTLVEDLRRLH